MVLNGNIVCAKNVLVNFQGVDYRLKLKGKTNRLKEMLIFTILPISCISLVFLIEICSFCKFIIRLTFHIT